MANELDEEELTECSRVIRREAKAAHEDALEPWADEHLIARLRGLIAQPRD